MGKRKERRLAAQSASSRRVKLDLFAEPSGDVVSTSINDEIGGVLDQNHHAGVPISPSSGQRQENPLFLLGQYSDDELDEEANKRPKPDVELDEEANKRPKPDVPGSSLDDQNGEVVELVNGDGDINCDEGKDLAAHVDKPESIDKDLDVAKKVDGNDIGETDVTDAINPCNGAHSSSQIHVTGTSAMQIIGDATSGWKIVMHEESSQYYYWNTISGETSWEVPEVLVQGAEMTNEPKVTPVIEYNGSVPDVHVSGSNLNGELEVYPNVPAIDGLGSTDLVTNMSKHEDLFEMEAQNKRDKSESHNVLKLGSVSNQADSGVNSALCGFVSTDQSTGTTSGIGKSTTTGEEHLIAKSDEGISSAGLVKYCEGLLQKLRALEGYYNDRTEGHEWRSKCILEIEIRLSDCKALSSYGSSLLPFWLHSETQLKRVESAINEKEASLLATSEQLNEVDSRGIPSCRGDNLSLQTLDSKSEVDENDKGVVPFTTKNDCTPPSSDDISNKADQKELHHMPNNEDAKSKVGVPIGFPGGHLGSEPEEGEVVQEDNENLVPVQLVSNIDPHACGDLDMDVDMDVDDETPANYTTAEFVKHLSPPQQSIHSIPHPPSVEFASLLIDEEFGVPPPPDEEWIPPPPPDNEVVPPPPPDDPTAPTYPLLPPYADPIPSLSYTEQYNVAYSIPTFEYYAPAMAEVTNPNYYAHTEGSQIAEAQPIPYYEPVANVFSEAAPAKINPVETIGYYDLQNGIVPTGTAVSCLGTSGYYGESSSISYLDTAGSDRTGFVGVASDSASTSLPIQKVDCDFPTVSNETQMATTQVAPISTTVQATRIPVVNEIAAAPTLPDAVRIQPKAAAPPLSDAAKNQPKVARIKKRTTAVAPMLRSNKKVSSLVDKWKAAKEELHGDEDDEPENAYEILEKKRQREIEEWRAQQIASGEAQANANFQPLGGDWRERVRRKKAGSASEAIQTPQTPPELTVNEKQQPNLVELSKDLPYGWQRTSQKLGRLISGGHI
ncbi:WW domain-containing protein isoform X2 [Tasmannia lanceolata]|uniref:WW domain-containing protein isoform X2 n=1 Tax=Tasmannia lanceolata TaxID=3420 RepID=UPI004062D782